MMDPFEVTSKDAEVLRSSHLAGEMEREAIGRDVFPVLIGSHIAHFHDVEGGYNRSEGYHVINLTHRVQGPKNPPNNTYSEEMEVHLDNYFHLEVEDVREFDDYPNEDYVLSLQVTGYMKGPYSFSEEMSERIDGRETEYNYDR